MADENRDDIVADPEQKTSNAAANTSTSTAPVNNDQSVNTPPNNNMGSGHPLDPNNSALGDSVWLGMDDNELAAEAGRLRDNEDEFPTLNSSLSGLGDDKSPANKESNDAPANKGANTSVLDRLNAANGKTEEAKKDDNTNTAEKGANTSVLDRLNAANGKTEEVKAQASAKDDFDIDSILAAAKTNTAQVNELKARTSAADATPKGPAPKQQASNAKGNAKSSEEEPDDDNPELDDEEEYEYDADGNRILRTNARRVNTGLGAQVRVNGSSKNNPNQSQANPKAAKQNTANKNAAANNNQSTASTGNAQASNNTNPAAASATPAAGAAATAAAGANTNQTPPSRPQQNSAQSGNQGQNAGGRPSGAPQGGNMPSSGGGGGGGGGTLGQNLGGLITNTVGLAKNTVGVAASAVGALPAFANAVKTGTNNLVSKKTTASATPAGTTTTTPTTTAGATTAPTTTRVPIPTSTIPNAKTLNGVPLTSAAVGQPTYSITGLRPSASHNQINTANAANAANYNNPGNPTNNLAPGPRLNLQHPLPPHKNLTPVNNNVVPISAAQKKTAPITPATAAAISANRANQPNNQASAKQFIQNLAQKSQQKKQGLFANLPADNPMHNLPSTTKQALEDAHNARNSINDNLSSIEKDNPIGTLRDKKQKGLNDGFRNYADSSEAANELLKNNNKKPGDREASLEATKYLNDMNKDVSKNTEAAKNKKLLDKDNDTNLQDKMKNIVESTKKIMESIKTTIENVAKLFTRNKPKP